MLKEQIAWLSMRLEEGADAVEIAQERELGQLEERVEKLDALLIYFAGRLKSNGSSHELSYSELYDYGKLIEVQVNAVLMYQKVAKHWTGFNKQRAKVLVDKALATHTSLRDALEEQCELLSQKIDHIDSTLKWRIHERQFAHGYDNRSAGRMFNLEG